MWLVLWWYCGFVVAVVVILLFLLFLLFCGVFVVIFNVVVVEIATTNHFKQRPALLLVLIFKPRELTSLIKRLSLY